MVSFIEAIPFSITEGGMPKVRLQICWNSQRTVRHCNLFFLPECRWCTSSWGWRVTWARYWLRQVGTCRWASHVVNCRLLVLLKGLEETKICWIAAEHALQHARSKFSLVSESFRRSNIQESDYVVLAGFDESLIKSGIGYLEQIHVFVSVEVDATSPLLCELGKIFSPLSSILFTESSSHYMPVFKDDGTVWEFNELVYFTASKFADGGSSAKTSLTVIGFSQGSSQVGNLTGLSQDASSSVRGDKNEERKSKKGKEQQRRNEDDVDKGDESDQNSDDHPEEPSGDESGTTTAPKGISFNVVSELCPIHNCQNPFQFLTLRGNLTIQVLLHRCQNMALHT